MNLSFDPLNQNYCSRRYPIYASNGMVNCSNPLAASAGLSILQKGGNAMDAAVAAAAALTVVEPTSNGIGSDAFALIILTEFNTLTNTTNASNIDIAFILLHTSVFPCIPVLVIIIKSSFFNSLQMSEP